MMTSAVFEAYINEAERIKALRALSLADVILLPHVSKTARRDWFRAITRKLLPRFSTNNVISFNGRQIGVKQLKKAFEKLTG